MCNPPFVPGRLRLIRRRIMIDAVVARSVRTEQRCFYRNCHHPSRLTGRSLICNEGSRFRMRIRLEPFAARGFKNGNPQSTGDTEVPPLDFWVPLQDLEVPPPEQCDKVYRIYCELATAATAAHSSWMNRLHKDYDIEASTLYMIGRYLISRYPLPQWKVGMSMLFTASELGHQPSILSVVRLVDRGLGHDSFLGSNIYRSCLRRFQAIVAREQDPDALTLQGLLLRRKGDLLKALQYFDLALKKGSPLASSQSSSGTQATTSRRDENVPRPYRWTWEASCHIGRGEILLKQGRREDSEAAFRIAALELDNPVGYLKLALLLPDDSPEKLRYLETAAVSGRKEAFRELGEMELRRARDPTQNGRQAEKHAMWASEWFRLADDSERAAQARWAHASS
ncbi:hypothetical protein VTK73DRAFT_7484 [Phialemonium thermophilum]|uniref:Uncharacterized protein n=1 Tax=Phialemonium thermophilum TaxID=223376 RepID=A0ABR3XSW0_9PEZI